MDIQRFELKLFIKTYTNSYKEKKDEKLMQNKQFLKDSCLH
jgi:hypothetical protein